MKLENIKVFSAMTAEEQERWVSEFTEWMDKGRRLAKLSSGWSRNDITDMEQGLRLLASWPFCEDFCEKTAHFADYDRRAYRLPLYIDKVVEELASGLTIQTVDGRKVVQVSPSVPLRRRGRPTKEEIAARLRGEALVVQGDDAEARRRRAIAKLLGMEVIVSGEAPREKNNAELKAEREARKAYILKQTKLTSEQQKKVMPILEAFLEELSANKKRHEAVKDKYHSADLAGKLTPAQAEEYMTSKFNKDEKELSIRRTYYSKLKAAIGGVKAREIIKFSDDKIK